ncbi:hypothetical protein [Bacillus sp. JJ864]|uniref:hypothetical protein n=1 Tax=Bacillus sp. JJ864 TaxID=3122975 RepID=UPI003F689F34
MNAGKLGFYVSHRMYNCYGLQNVKADFFWITRYGKKTVYACDLCIMLTTQQEVM